MKNLFHFPDNHGYGDFGGQFVAETLIAPLRELELAYQCFKEDQKLQKELENELRNFVGRQTPLTFLPNLSRRQGGAKIYLKREDLAHTGAHKINNAIGQMFLAKYMGKTQIIAETGAGQHGVATATAAARLGLKCRIYMGKVDAQRQKLNVYRMKLLGAEVVEVDLGSQTLKDAINEAMRDWVAHPNDCYYLLGSALGPYPYPQMVRDFQSVIGKEAREQILKCEDRLPSEVIACVGGGSNAIGIFSGFLNDDEVKLIGVEAGGKGIQTGAHAARFEGGKLGVFQGTLSYVLQNELGQINHTHSIAAGLDYASIGPEHAYLHQTQRAFYTYATDDEVLESLKLLCETEGILPALESAHALAYASKRASQLSSQDILLVNLSGRGDKDLPQLFEQEKI